MEIIPPRRRVTKWSPGSSLPLHFANLISLAVRRVWMKFHLWPPWMRTALGMLWSCAFLARVLGIFSVEFLHSGHAFSRLWVLLLGLARGRQAPKDQDNFSQWKVGSGSCHWHSPLCSWFLALVYCPHKGAVCAFGPECDCKLFKLCTNANRKVCKHFSCPVQERALVPALPFLLLPWPASCAGSGSGGPRPRPLVPFTTSTSWHPAALPFPAVLCACRNAVRRYLLSCRQNCWNAFAFPIN